MNAQEEGWIKELSRDLEAAGFKPPADELRAAGYGRVSPLGIVRQCRALLDSYQQLRTPKVEARAEAASTTSEPPGQLLRRRRRLMNDGPGRASESAPATQAVEVSQTLATDDDAPRRRRHVPAYARG